MQVAIMGNRLCGQPYVCTALLVHHITTNTFSIPLLCAADTRNGLLNTPNPDPAIISPMCRRFKTGDVGMACRDRDDRVQCMPLGDTNLIITVFIL